MQLAIFGHENSAPCSKAATTLDGSVAADLVTVNTNAAPTATGILALGITHLNAIRSNAA